MRNRLARIGVMMLVGVITGSAQTSPQFEVASIKPALADAPVRGLPAAVVTGAIEESVRFQGGPGSKTPERIDYAAVTLKQLLQRAYGVNADQISGPGWLGKERYDILATLPAGTDAEGLRLMLQDLLAERFQVSLHRETKTLPVYRMTVAKGGSRLKAPVKEQLPEYKDDKERQATGEARARAGMDAMVARLLAGEAVPNSFGMLSATTATLAEMLSKHTIVQ